MDQSVENGNNSDKRGHMVHEPCTEAKCCWRWLINTLSLFAPVAVQAALCPLLHEYQDRKSVV